MFKVMIDNNEFAVKFAHKEVDDKNITFCFVLKNKDLIAQSEVHRFIKDHNNKYLANYYAFNKAINVETKSEGGWEIWKVFNRETRTILWVEYWKHTSISKLKK